jgi:hypothetical protein
LDCNPDHACCDFGSEFPDTITRIEHESGR